MTTTAAARKDRNRNAAKDARHMRRVVKEAGGYYAPRESDEIWAGWIVPGRDDAYRVSLNVAYDAVLV